MSSNSIVSTGNIRKEKGDFSNILSSETLLISFEFSSKIDIKSSRIGYFIFNPGIILSFLFKTKILPSSVTKRS